MLRRRPAGSVWEGTVLAAHMMPGDVSGAVVCR